MTRGILIVLALATVCGRVGLAIGNWWADNRMPSAELETAVPPFVGTVLGAVAGIAIGVAVAYAIGKRELG